MDTLAEFTLWLFCTLDACYSTGTRLPCASCLTHLLTTSFSSFAGIHTMCHAAELTALMALHPKALARPLPHRVPVTTCKSHGVLLHLPSCCHLQPSLCDAAAVNGGIRSSNLITLMPWVFLPLAAICIHCSRCQTYALNCLHTQEYTSAIAQLLKNTHQQ